jgi:hypothetical protein
MLKLIEVIVNPHEYCYIHGYINAEQHSACATFVLQELVEKLSVEDTGELLLQPFGYTKKLLEHLIDTSLAGEVVSIRRSATKLLCFLLRRIADSDILYMISAGGGAAPAPAYVPNRLFPLRCRIINQINQRIQEFMSALILEKDHDNETEKSSSYVKYSSYTVNNPFTVLRSVFIEFITLMVESDDTVADLIPVELWKILISWILKYAHNSIFHAIFFRLIFSVLRQEQESAQRSLFQKAKFATFLIENFVPFPKKPSDLPGKNSAGVYANKYAARGLIMNCANAVRLQTNNQPPTAFLKQFILSHHKWANFLIPLKTATSIQQQYAFGVKVPEHNKAFKDNTIPNNDTENDGSDVGSRYAKSLGFFDEPAWNNCDDSQQDDNARAELKKKVKKNKKKKTKKKRSSSGSSEELESMVGGHENEKNVNDREVCKYMYMYMYKHMYIYIFIYIQINIYVTYIYCYSFVFVYMHMYMFVSLRIYI